LRYGRFFGAKKLQIFYLNLYLEVLKVLHIVRYILTYAVCHSFE